MPTVPLLIVSASPHRGRNTGGYLVNYYHQKRQNSLRKGIEARLKNSFIQEFVPNYTLDAILALKNREAAPPTARQAKQSFVKIE